MAPGHLVRLQTRVHAAAAAADDAGELMLVYTPQCVCNTALSMPQSADPQVSSYLSQYGKGIAI